ncbi:hypothetical protein F4777DRAFT_544144 [Nemania sp. FL0916]|nr:hypothetical protein F4777DRAFT_544144 [Nemania sp. FL0916]
MLPSYAQATATTAGANTEQSPLLSSRSPHSSPRIHISIRFRNRNPTVWPVVIAVVGLHLIAGYYVFRYLTDHWRSIPPLNTYNVAVIGAGPTGIAAAQYLHDASRNQNVRFRITIYESKPVVGGVLALHDVNGSSVFPKDDPMQSPIAAEDIAGNALTWSNALFTRDSQHFLKDNVNVVELGPENIGYYKNAVKIVSATRPYRETPLNTWLWMVWNYGSSVWRGDNLAQAGNLRKAIFKVPLVSDIDKIFSSLGVLKPLRQQAKTTLKDRGISDQYAADILEPQVQRACGQSLNQVTGLTAMMAASEEDSANTYQGGDLLERLRRIVSEMDDVDVRTSTRVVGIRQAEISENHTAWLVRYEEGTDDSNRNESIESFDKVIMAAADFSIEFENSEAPSLALLAHYNADAADTTTTTTTETVKRAESPYIPVYITFFTTREKLSSWYHDDNQMLFVEPVEESGEGEGGRGSGMQELAFVREITDARGWYPRVEYLYRALSRRPVLEDLKRRIEMTWSYEAKIDSAYPISLPVHSFPSFRLPWAKGLWWTSVIQRAATSVDLNWLAGKIVARDLIREVLED